MPQRRAQSRNQSATSRVVFVDLQPAPEDVLAEVVAGLSRQRKTLPPKLFYDVLGSQLFEAITELPEYYVTRTEIELLERHGEEIAAEADAGAAIIELGSGSSRKIRLLLEALRPAAYLPIEISREHLRHSADALSEDCPDLDIYATCADYTTPLRLDYLPETLPRVAFFPGSSIGNFEPAAAIELMTRVAALLDHKGLLLIGVDLKKDRRLLDAAYNDAQGVTARFNLNVLARLNRELAADFDLRGFEHHAFYNAALGRMEMHLISRCTQQVNIDHHTFDFAAGETIHTENSYKYHVSEFHALAARAGFVPMRVWMDRQRLFSLHLLRATRA